MKFDRAAFFAAYRTAFRTSDRFRTGDRIPKPVRLSQSQVDGLLALLSFIEDDTAIVDLRWAAYMLATIKHECADTWQPIIERGPKSYFTKYEPGTAVGKRLGNTVPGDGYRYRGRGFVQITGRANYKRMSDWLSMTLMGYDLVDFPELALKPDVAYFIMSEGMKLGGFTGKKLSDYINDKRCDYTQARRIINGLDRAALIAGYAVALEGVLRTALIVEPT